MVRHGHSVWNASNRFCGWYDADLAETGVEEAKKAAQVCYPHIYLESTKIIMRTIRYDTIQHDICEYLTCIKTDYRTAHQQVAQLW